MTFDLQRILEGKRKLRRDLAARPFAEKLAMLDALRERAVLLRRAGHSNAVHEAQEKYGRPADPSHSRSFRDQR